MKKCVINEKAHVADGISRKERLFLLIPGTLPRRRRLYCSV